MDADDRPPDDTPLERVAPASAGQRALVPLFAIAAALLIGALRPWDLVATPPVERGVAGSATVPTVTGTGATSGSGSRTGGAPAPPTASPPADPYAQLWATCGSPSGWRVATVQLWTGRTGPIRSWIATEPIVATGPLDPRIPFAPVATDVVTAIGYCAPLDEQLRPPTTARAELWTILAGVAVPLTAPALEPAEPNALGGLWRPAPEVALEVNGMAAWPAGRYVVRIRSPTDSFDRWLGIEIEDLGARHGGASPSAPPWLASPPPSAPPSTTP